MVRLLSARSLIESVPRRPGALAWLASIEKEFLQK